MPATDRSELFRRLTDPQPSVRRVALLDVTADATRRAMAPGELMRLVEGLVLERDAGVRRLFVRCLAAAWSRDDRSEPTTREVWQGVARCLEDEYTKQPVDVSSAIAGLRLADAIWAG